MLIASASSRAAHQTRSPPSASSSDAKLAHGEPEGQAGPVDIAVARDIVVVAKDISQKDTDTDGQLRWLLRPMTHPLRRQYGFIIHDTVREAVTWIADRFTNPPALDDCRD